jgi:hypothetical protein
LAILAMATLFALMKSIRRHYSDVSAELALDAGEGLLLPSNTRAVVLVSQLHKPTMRALGQARSARPTTLVALTVNLDGDGTRRLREDWERAGLDVPLVVLDSPYREIVRPVLEYLRGLHRAGPRDVITVFIPEYVVGRWWEQLLHNQSALRLKARLLFEPGVLVTSVPYQLRSSDIRTGVRMTDVDKVPGCPTCPRPRPRTGSTSKRSNVPSRSSAPSVAIGRR